MIMIDNAPGMYVSTRYIIELFNLQKHISEIQIPRHLGISFAEVCRKAFGFFRTEF